MTISRYYKRLIAEGKIQPRPDKYAACQAAYLSGVSVKARALSMQPSLILRVDARAVNFPDEHDPDTVALRARDEIIAELSKAYNADQLSYATEMCRDTINAAIVRHNRRNSQCP